MAVLSEARAFQWLAVVLSERGPPEPLTKLVLCAVFQRVNWETGRGFFEASRTLARRLGLNKDTVNKHLGLATSECWLTRTKRSRTDAKGNERHGFVYALSFKHLVSEQTAQKADSRCPNGARPVSEQTGAGVRTVRTYSPPNPLSNLRSAVMPNSQNLRSRLIRAAKHSSERNAFEQEYPEVVPHLQRIGGWSALGRSNEQSELPRLIDRVIDSFRSLT